MKGFVQRVVCISLLLACVGMSAQAQNYQRGDYKRQRGSGLSSTYRTITSPGMRRDRGYWNYDNYTGFRIGLNVASLSFDGTSGVSKSTMEGLNLGIVGGFRIAPMTPIYFEPGLLYTQKGVKGSKGSEELKVSMHYLEVPLVFKYKAYLNTSSLNEMSLQPFFGPYLAVGFAGKLADIDQREKVSTFEDNAFRHFDAGLRMGCGFEFEHLYLELSYDLGLANVAREDFNHFGYDDFNDKIHTSTFSATMGFNF